MDAAAAAVAVAVAVPQEAAAMEASKLSGFLRSKGDANRRGIMPPPPPPPGCGMGRKSLSDITNLAVAGPRMRSVGQEQALERAAPPTGPYDDHTRLIKENSALLKLVAERNQMIEMSSIEVQKLRVTLQKTTQQNWQLAQANSQMIAELNLGKDRLKNLQHELGCVSALLQARTIELEEIKKTNKKHKTLRNEMEHQQKNDVVEIPEEPCNPASQKNPCNVARKRPLRTQSLGPGVATTGAATKEKDECRRRSLRRKSSNSKSEPCEPKGELFEIEDIKFPIRSHEEETGATSADAISNNKARKKPAKDEVHEEEDGRSSATADQNEVSRRSSIGRPSRKAAEKVTCYKELRLNIKMRRD